jgi:gentisate 1,2-dioxygenase
VKLAKRQPLVNGKRRARFACIRNTYGQLADTTIKTFLHWLPDGVFGTYAKADHAYYLNRLDDLCVFRSS